jgi:Na+/H+ antiporter NhaC
VSESESSLLSLLPTALVFVMAVWTRRPIESLICGSLLGLVSFMTGSNWGVFVIVLPIVTTLAQNLGADMTLVIGATLSASTFGSHACFYSDATVLTAQATGCTPLQHALTQIPYALIAAVITVIGYLGIAYL